jgi:hypothetical protein
MWLILYWKNAILEISDIRLVFRVAALRDNGLYCQHFRENFCSHFQSGGHRRGAI